MKVCESASVGIGVRVCMHVGAREHVQELLLTAEHFSQPRRRQS